MCHRPAPDGRTRVGRQQRPSRRDQPPVQRAGRGRDTSPSRSRRPTGAPDRPTLVDLQQRAEDAFSNSIGDRSRRTYGAGVRHWDEFRAAYLIPELGSATDDEGNVAAFLAYLVLVVGVAPQTSVRPWTNPNICPVD